MSNSEMSNGVDNTINEQNNQSKDQIELGPVDKRTRFQVNKVHTTTDNNQQTGNNNHDTLIDIQPGDADDYEDGDAGYKASETAPLNCDTAASYDTKYGKSFRHFTREALPRLDNYRNIMSIQAAYRPTLDELHHPSITVKPISPQNVQNKGGGVASNDAEQLQGQLKFGWIKGVLVRCLLNIWGVMLFLRLSWVVAQAGIGEACILILTTTVVTTITALSMSAISTNGVIKGGGTYYMISRSLGPEFGGSIGLIFALANAVACAMYVVGFCESMNDLLASFGLQIVDGGVQDVRIIGAITILILLIIVVVGMEWEAKAQIGLLVILLLAMADFMIGTFVGPRSDEAIAKGFIGYDWELFTQNFVPDYRESEGVEHNFFSVFSIFFPAATGILAGANISGDLKDPQTSIPKGTILAIILTSFSYIVMAIMAGWTVARDATGNVADLVNNTFLNCTDIHCEYGLHNSFQVIELVSVVGPIIYAGCFAATLSSALASLVSAPKVFQALCRDKLYPKIEWFAKGYGNNNEPVRGYILTFFIAIGFILIGELNLIAPLISNFFLAAYTLINFSTFHASLAKPVGWRPTFKYYSMWLSLLGSILCVLVMFLISWITALLTMSVVMALYLIVQYRKPAVNWGSTTQAQTYKNALNAVHQLNSVEEHVKNYRPQILVLTGLPGTRPPLVDFAHLLTKNLSMLVCGHISKECVSNRVRSILNHKGNGWLKSHKIKAFYTFVDDSSFEEGAKALMQASGVGKLKPNILLMGYKSNWRKCPLVDLNMYFEVMHKALDMHLAVCILRLQDGLDYSRVLGVGLDEFGNSSLIGGGGGAAPQTQTNLDQSLRSRRNSTDSLIKDNNFGQISQASSTSDISIPLTPSSNRLRNNVNACPNPEDDTVNISKTTETSKDTNEKKDEYKGPGGTELPKDIINNLCQFQRKQKKTTIDVWWLYDDGGLTLLLPYIISTRHTWSGCRLRVFALANKQSELECEQRNMASLLAKFRIDYSDLQIIPDITRKPHDNTRAFFETLLTEFRVPLVDGDPDSAPISEADLIAMKDKTNRHLRLRELLLQHSQDAGLVVMTLPMPRKNIVSAPLYLAWLEVLTRDMPPFLLVRGNHTSVLTFYS